eukprot:52677_4
MELPLPMQAAHRPTTPPRRRTPAPSAAVGALGFDSPFVCNCDHGWAEHKTVLKRKRVQTMHGRIMAGTHITLLRLHLLARLRCPMPIVPTLCFTWRCGRCCCACAAGGGLGEGVQTLADVLRGEGNEWLDAPPPPSNRPRRQSAGRTTAPDSDEGNGRGWGDRGGGRA